MVHSKSEMKAIRNGQEKSQEKSRVKKSQEKSSGSNVASNPESVSAPKASKGGVLRSFTALFKRSDGAAPAAKVGGEHGVGGDSALVGDGDAWWWW